MAETEKKQEKETEEKMVLKTTDIDPKFKYESRLSNSTIRQLLQTQKTRANGAVGIKRQASFKRRHMALFYLLYMHRPLSTRCGNRQHCAGSSKLDCEKGNSASRLSGVSFQHPENRLRIRDSRTAPQEKGRARITSIAKS